MTTVSSLDTYYVAKLWDWEDNQIASCIRSGPRVDPMARRLFERLGL